MFSSIALAAASRWTIFEAAAKKVPLPLFQRRLTEQLPRDLPLRLLVAACQAFWS